MYTAAATSAYSRIKATYTTLADTVDADYFAHRGMICPACGTGKEESDNYCAECGYQLQDSPTVADLMGSEDCWELGGIDASCFSDFEVEEGDPVF